MTVTVIVCPMGSVRKCRRHLRRLAGEGVGPAGHSRFQKVRQI